MSQLAPGAGQRHGLAAEAVAIAEASVNASGEGRGFLQKCLVVRSGIALDLGKPEQAEATRERHLLTRPPSTGCDLSAVGYWGATDTSSNWK